MAANLQKQLVNLGDVICKLSSGEKLGHFRLDIITLLNHGLRRLEIKKSINVFKKLLFKTNPEESVPLSTPINQLVTATDRLSDFIQSAKLAAHLVTSQSRVNSCRGMDWIPVMDTRDTKVLIKVHIEYRCPKCRNCQDCWEAHETERISLKEEAEDALIRDSVTLDYENKRFHCKLPMRGKPEDYLTTNMNDANKVLDRQVNLYHGEEETRVMIVKAMTKLFDNNHVTLIKNLPLEQQNIILNRLVQYHVLLFYG